MIRTVFKLSTFNPLRRSSVKSKVISTKLNNQVKKNERNKRKKGALNQKQGYINQTEQPS